ncbi:MAG: hypothetical protein KGV44_09085 [Flavobacteriaceae bacterium]|nr:hypothetical protein [Flavobacteriaceae bacterium]
MEEKKDYIIVEQEGTEQNTQRIPFQEDLPNATMVLTLGILSIVLSLCCCFFNLIVLPLAIIGWVMGHKGVNAYKANPSAYTLASYKNMNAGKICSIVGFVLIVLFTIWMCFSFVVGIEQAGGWDAYLEMIREQIENAQ